MTTASLLIGLNERGRENVEMKRPALNTGRFGSGLVNSRHAAFVFNARLIFMGRQFVDRDSAVPGSQFFQLHNLSAAGPDNDVVASSHSRVVIVQRCQGGAASRL